MTTMWLVCLSLLVAADAASLGPRAVDIPVQIVYDETPVKSILVEDAAPVVEPIVPNAGPAVSLKNLAEKPQLSVEEIVEAEVLNIPAGIIKISDEVQVAKEQLDSTSSSEESKDSSEEVNSSESLESNEVNNEVAKEPIVQDIPIVPIVNIEPTILKAAEQEQIIEQLAVAEDVPIAGEPAILEVVEQVVEDVPIVPVVNNEEPTILEVVEQEIVAVEKDVAKGKSVAVSTPEVVLVEAVQNIEPAVVQEEQKIEPQADKEVQKIDPEIVQEAQNLPLLEVEQEIVAVEKDAAKGKSVSVAAPEVVVVEQVQKDEPQLVAEVQNTEPQVLPEVQNIEPSIVPQVLEEVQNTPSLVIDPVQITEPKAEVKPEEIPLESDPVLKVQLREANPEPAIQAAAPANQIVQEAAIPSPKPTTEKPPSGPLAGLQNVFNRLGETVGLRPTDAPAKSDAAVAGEPAASTAAPTNLIGGFQQNINNQLSTFGNRVNGFIDNLRPRQPTVAAAVAENDEVVTPTPNTPFLNFVQTQFNNGLTGFSDTVNNALGGQQASTQEDEPSPAQPSNPIFQQISNGAAQFQQSFAGFINNFNQPQQQSDESTPSNTNNVGQQILGIFQTGLSGIVNNFNRPETTGANVQGDDAVTTPAPASGPFGGITSAFSNLGQQFNNFISGGQAANPAQAIPSQLTEAGQAIAGNIPGASTLTQLPGASQLTQLPAQGAQQIQQLQGQVPGASQIQGLIPGAPSLTELTGQIPGASQLQQGAQQIASNIPGADQLLVTTTTTTVQPAAVTPTIPAPVAPQ